MKKKTIAPVLIYALPALLAATHLPAQAAGPDARPATVEKHVEVRSFGATAAAPGVPVPPPAPVTFLGVEVAPVDEALAAQLKLPPEHGLIVRFVVPDSPAAAAGVQKHDVLTRLDDQLLIAPRQLSALVRARKEGEAIRLTYVRAGAEARAAVTLVKRVPSAASVGDQFQWFGQAGDVHTFPAHQTVAFRAVSGPAGGTTVEADHLIGAPTIAGGPHVMVFRPQARIVYREGDVTLEVTTTDRGRQLEARGADGKTLFSGPIDTAEQREAVPADLRKHLDALDALEPAQFNMPVPAPAPHVMPLPAPAPGSGSAAMWESATPAVAGATHAVIAIEGVPAPAEGADADAI